MVNARAYEMWDMSVAQLWGSGPKARVICGACGTAFKQRITMRDNPRVCCPCCRTVNVLKGLRVA